MKKILLLTVVSCFMMQTKIVFGKCHASLTITRASDNATWAWNDGTYPANTAIPISPADHLTCIFNCTGVCTMYYPAWYRMDQNGNYVMIQSSNNNNTTLNTNIDGGYKVQSTNCTCFSYNFSVVIITGINDLTTSTFPYPFSRLSSNVNINNLRYKIITPMGQIAEEGQFSGEIILRNQKPQQSLPAGIYFVIYSDALDNRQVLTDKVFVTNQ